MICTSDLRVAPLQLLSVSELISYTGAGSGRKGGCRFGCLLLPAFTLGGFALRTQGVLKGDMQKGFLYDCFFGRFGAITFLLFFPSLMSFPIFLHL